VSTAPDASAEKAPASAELSERAARLIPGGVNSPVRGFDAVGGTPRFIASASGPRITDVDGATYLDYVGSYGPAILGHAHPEVLAAAQTALQAGSTFGMPTVGEVALAEEIADRVPGVEMVRAVSSGTEAGMDAVRLARGATGRSKVVKFTGHYHGHSDALLAAAGSGMATLGIPATPGVTAGAAADTIVVDWNDRDGVEAAMAAHGDDVAVVACEPVAANMGVVPPEPGFLEFLRRVADEHGALLLFDEVLTGFRVARGGAAEWSGVAPDLVCLGKVVGGGLPLAAFGGSAQVMSHLAPIGSIYQAGTLSGNPVAVAAGLAQLRLLDAAAYADLQARADALIEGLRDAFAAEGIPVAINRAGSLFSLFFTDEAVTDKAAVDRADHERYAAFFHGMLARGHHFPPAGYEAVFISTAHSIDDIEATVAAARQVARELP
jgi:glutamate-1-semialdehyde 2,1-aminomutase